MRKWLAPKRLGFTRRHLLRDDLIETRSAHERMIEKGAIHEWVAKAKLADEEPKILAFLDSALAEYRRAQFTDEGVVWSGQVVALAKRVRNAELALRLTKSEETIIRKTTVSPFAYADIQGALGKLAADLDGLIKDVGEPTKSGAQAIMHQRQVELARRFWGVFTTNGWLPDRNQSSANSLMARLLGLVLEAAGEKRATITRLLEEARLNP